VAVWELHIDATTVNNELVKVQLENEKKLAMHHLHTIQLEKELEESKRIIFNKRSQNQQLQRMLSTTTNDLRELEESNRQLQRTNKRLSSVTDEESVQKVKRKRNDFAVLSRQQQWLRKKQLCADIGQALNFMENDGIKAAKVTFIHSETNQKESLDLATGKYKSDNEVEYSQIEFVLYVKEIWLVRCCLS